MIDCTVFNCENKVEEYNNIFNSIDEVLEYLDHINEDSPVVVSLYNNIGGEYVFGPNVDSTIEIINDNYEYYHDNYNGDKINVIYYQGIIIATDDEGINRAFVFVCPDTYTICNIYDIFTDEFNNIIRMENIHLYLKRIDSNEQNLLYTNEMVTNYDDISNIFNSIFNYINDDLDSIM